MTIRLAANISLLWSDLPWLDRLHAAADAGFEGVEALFPYDIPVPETQGILNARGLSFVLLNAPPPNYTGGARGFAAVPEASARCATDLRRAVRYAKTLGGGLVHVMSGEANGPEARATLVANLKAAAEGLPDGISLTIEPLNPVDVPGYFLNDFGQAVEILDDVGAPQVGLQFDSYHAQMITGDAVKTCAKVAPYIRHVQIGDAPGRGAPGTGEVDFASLVETLRDAGYDGWISAEYKPGTRTDKTLGWMRDFL